MWWSKREARQYARIMFLDMTDQVLMEQEKADLEAHNAYLLDEIRTERNFGAITLQPAVGVNESFLREIAHLLEVGKKALADPLDA